MTLPKAPCPLLSEPGLARTYSVKGSLKIIPEVDEKAFIIGSYGTRYSWDGTAYSIVNIWVTSTSLAPDSPVMVLRVNSAAVTTSERLLAMEVQSRTTGTAALRGIEAHIAFEGGSTVLSDSCGLYVRAQIAASVTHSTGAIYAGYFYIRSQSATGGELAVLRLECNSSTATWDDEWIIFLGNPNYVFKFDQNTRTSYSRTGTPSNGEGWLKIRVGGSDRYILLYNTAP